MLLQHLDIDDVWRRTLVFSKDTGPSRPSAAAAAAEFAVKRVAHPRVAKRVEGRREQLLVAIKVQRLLEQQPKLPRQLQAVFFSHVHDFQDDLGRFPFVNGEPRR